MKTAILEPPRWPGGPRICSVTNLMAFESDKEAGNFRERNCPHCVPDEQFKCEACGKIHFTVSVKREGAAEEQGTEPDQDGAPKMSTRVDTAKRAEKPKRKQMELI